MAMNRIQFQPGLSLRELNKLYGTETQCEEALEKMRWPTGFRCPKCQNESHCIVWHGETKTFQCNRCHTQTTLTGGTIFHATKLCLVIWFQAMYLMTQSKNHLYWYRSTRAHDKLHCECDLTLCRDYLHPL